ncbi:MAG: hypothetical protein IPK92_04990 [Nitrospira sp.]|nr:hypothetical protein [Nitrospira sp.]MBL8052184.1 hypothetical protein [Nitrospira sp.]
MRARGGLASARAIRYNHSIDLCGLCVQRLAWTSAGIISISHDDLFKPVATNHCADDQILSSGFLRDWYRVNPHEIMQPA